LKCLFVLLPLDRYETSLLSQRALIPRNVLNLWITIGLMVGIGKFVWFV
jgi:hypothetical protein